MLSSLIGHAQTSDPISKIEEYVSRWHKTGRFHGVVLVAENDKVLFVKGFGYANREWEIPNTPETKFDIGSISKQFTTAMIFQLIAEGKIQLADRLSDHLSEYRKDTGARVTVDHLLQHTSGIPCYVRDWRASEAEKENEYPRLLRRHLKSPYLVSQYMSGDLLFEPGSQYRYSNSNHYLLGKIIERITGKSFDENLNERILKPLDLNNTGLCDFEKIISNMYSGYVDVPSKDGKAPYYFYPNLYGTGGMYSTVEDLYRWNRALETDLLVSSALRKKLFTPYWEKEGRHSYLFNHFSMTMPTSGRTVPYTSFSGAFDGFRADAFRFPDSGHIIVIFDNSEQESHWEMAPGLFKILMGEPCENPAVFTSSRIGPLFGEAYGSQMYDHALHICRLWMRGNPLAAGPYFSMARVYIKTGKIDEAAACYQKVIELFPGQFADAAKKELKKLQEENDKE